MLAFRVGTALIVLLLSAVDAWAASCVTTRVRARACPPGHVLLDVGAGHLGVDVSLEARGAFIQAGGLGASPLGNYSDWGEASATDRAAFDAPKSGSRPRT